MGVVIRQPKTRGREKVSGTETAIRFLTPLFTPGLPVVATPVGVVIDLQQDHGLSLTTVPVHPTPIQLAAAVHQATSSSNRVFINHARTVR
jgi:hypothetical protein